MWPIWQLTRRTRRHGMTIKKTKTKTKKFVAIYWHSDTVDYIHDKLRNSNHEFEGLVTDSQRVVNRPSRWSLYLSLALCVDHPVSAPFQQRDMYSNALVREWPGHCPVDSIRNSCDISYCDSDKFFTKTINVAKGHFPKFKFKECQELSLNARWVVPWASG